MPHWIIFHPPGTFEDEDTKRALTKSITSHYHRDGAGMPAFYVVVNFVLTQPSDQWIGGQKAIEYSPRPFIRIQASHIHIRLPAEADVYKSQMERLNAVLKPFIADKGYDFELHVVETERQLWTINTLAPPPFCSADEAVWKAENRSVRPEDVEAMRAKHRL